MVHDRQAHLGCRPDPDLTEFVLETCGVCALKQARTKFETRLADLRHAISQLQAASHGLVDFLRGPSRYLVLAGNNAEMRDGSGAFLQIGMLTVDNGMLKLDTIGTFENYAASIAPAPAEAPVSASRAARRVDMLTRIVAAWRALGSP